MLLLLAIPPLVANILACENAEKADAATAAVAKSDAVAKDIAAPAATAPMPAPATTVTPAPGKPARGSSSNGGIKSWFIM